MLPDLPRESSAPDPHDFVLPAKLALEAARVGIWQWDVKSKILSGDPTTHQLCGGEPGPFAASGGSLDGLIHPDDREYVQGAVDRSVATGEEFNCEFRVVWPGDQSVHYLHARGQAFRSHDGSAHLTGACWDITGRKLVESQLAHERFLLRTLAEHIPDKIYFKDTESRFIWASRETLLKFNTTDPADVLGKTDFDFFREEHARPAFEDEQRIIRTGEPLVNVEERETWADGHETWVSTTKMPLQDETGRIVGTFGLSRDITERRRAEARLAQYAEELRRKNQDLEEDLHMARELQDALLPREYPCFPHDAIPRESALHFSHFFNPSAAVSGDFFDILPLSDTSAGIFICDVMGHGVRAALVAAIVRALMEEMRSIAGTPGKFIERLNAKLCAILKQTEIPMFVSAFYIVADLAKGELRYANAGHPDPVCIRQEGTVRRTENLNHAKRGPVLGMFAEATYETSRTPLSVHDVLLLFTDGLFEVEGADGELFDQQSLTQAVSRRAHLTTDEICSGVLAEIRNFSANDEFSDDVCLVAVEVERLSTAGPSPNLRTISHRRT